MKSGADVKNNVKRVILDKGELWAELHLHRISAVTGLPVETVIVLETDTEWLPTGEVRTIKGK